MKRNAKSKPRAATVSASKSKRARFVAVGALLAVGSVAAVMNHYRSQRTANAQPRSVNRATPFLKRLDEMQSGVDTYYRCVSEDKDQPPKDVKSLMNSLATYNEGKYSSLGKRVKTVCNATLSAAISAFEQGDPVPTEAQDEWLAYVRSVRGLLEPMQRFADAASKHASEDRLHYRITLAAERWGKRSATASEAARFEQFLGCAIPELGKMYDRKDLTRWYAGQCVRGNVLDYMERVTKECAPYLAEPGDAGAAPATEARPSAAQLAAARRFRAVQVRGVPLLRLVLGICTGNVRKKWLGVDGTAVLSAANEVFDAKRALHTALHALPAGQQ
jgi:hypothetical protein